MKTKLENILETLDQKQLINFKSLVKTSLFDGNNDHVILLTRYMNKPLDIKGAKRTSNQINTKERLLMSDLYNMLKQYIVILKNKNDENQKSKLLLEHFKKYENEKLFTEIYNKSDAALNNNMANASNYEQKAELKYQKWQFDQVKNRFSNADVEEIIMSYDIAMISKKLMLTVSLAAQSSLISKNIDLSFIASIENYIHHKNYLAHPCISLYYYALKMIIQPEEEQYFYKYSIELKQHKECFPKDEFKSLYFYAINFCIRKFNHGSKEFGERLLEYYQEALREEYLLTNGYLSRNSYRNINTIALRMQNFDVANDITHSYKHLLRHDDRQSAYHFNLASIHYTRKEYDDAVSALNHVEFEDHLSNIFAKALLIKIHYEIKSERLLDSYLDALKAYIIRKKIIGYHKSNYINMIKYIRKLISTNQYDQKEIIEIEEKIKEEKSLPDKVWFLEQINLLKKPRNIV